MSVARHSKDIDLYYAGLSAAPEEATAALVAAADRDVGDHFRFEVIKTTNLQEAAKGRRVHLSAYLGGLYANFHVDVVVGTPMSGQPDRVPPLTPLQIDGLLRPDYRAFPLADHCADKLCAVIETHEQVGGTRVSSRVKDLVDLALIARSQTIDGPALRTAILAGTGHRGLPLPAAFAVPDWEIWQAGLHQAHGRNAWCVNGLHRRPTSGQTVPRPRPSWPSNRKMGPANRPLDTSVRLTVPEQDRHMELENLLHAGWRCTQNPRPSSAMTLRGDAAIMTASQAFRSPISRRERSRWNAALIAAFHSYSFSASPIVPPLTVRYPANRGADSHASTHGPGIGGAAGVGVVTIGRRKARRIRNQALV